MVIIPLHLLQLLFCPAVTAPPPQSLFRLHHFCLRPHVTIVVATCSMIHGYNHLLQHDTCSDIFSIFSFTRQITIYIAPHLHLFLRPNTNSPLYNLTPPTLSPSKTHTSCVSIVLTDHFGYLSLGSFPSLAHQDLCRLYTKSSTWHHIFIFFATFLDPINAVEIM